MSRAHLQDSARRFFPYASAAALLVISFSVACSLGEYLFEIRWGKEGILDFLLSGSRRALSESFYETADMYFHHGVPHIEPRAFHDVFQQLHLAVAPEKHVHTHGSEVKEIMPWLRFATLADPHNVEAYLVASYWLADEYGRPDLALGVIREALRYNPRDYRLYAEAGGIHMMLHDKVNAARMLDAGIRLWPSGLSAAEKQVRLELARMLSYRGFLYELDGDAARALQVFDRAREMFPHNHALQERVERLRQGQLNREWARSAWDHLFPRKHVCGRAEHADHGSHDHGPGLPHLH